LRKFLHDACDKRKPVKFGCGRAAVKIPQANPRATGRESPGKAGLPTLAKAYGIEPEDVSLGELPFGFPHEGSALSGRACALQFRRIFLCGHPEKSPRANGNERIL